MKALSDLLRDADPLREDPGLSVAEARVIRRLVVDAANERDTVSLFAHQPFAIAAVLLLMVAAGITTGRHVPTKRTTPLADPTPAATAGGERRQLQFATPGGTRIIWTFDPDFMLKETMP